ncbi:MAG: PilN domain-containing protein [Chitinivibrionales bacterium]
MKQKSFITTLSLLLNSNWDIRIGVSGFATADERHVIIARHRRKRTVKLLRVGEKLRYSWITMMQPVIHIDCGLTPVVYVNEDLHGEEPEKWIDREEQRLIPRGLNSEQVVTEWDTNNQRIVAASVRADALEKLAEAGKKRNLVFSSVSFPLMDCAGVYAKKGKNDFLLWDIGETGSMIGRVERGELTQLMMHWVGRKDLEREPEDSLSITVSLMKTLARNSEIECIVPEHHKFISAIAESAENAGNILFVAPPAVACVAQPYHRAYALAMHEQTHADFAPFEHTRKAAAHDRSRSTMMAAARWAVVATLFIAFGIGAAAGGIGIARVVTEKKISPVRAGITEMNRVECSYDSLRQVFDKSARFLGRESVVTEFFSELQHAFPEGVWAETITLSEKDRSAWDIDIIAVSYSTASIPSLISRMEKINGVQDVKMQYSEQTQVGSKWRKKNAVRLKLVCSWENRI